MSLLRNYRVKYYDYCKVVRFYCMRLVCIAGYLIHFCFKIVNTKDDDDKVQMRRAVQSLYQIFFMVSFDGAYGD